MQVRPASCDLMGGSSLEIGTDLCPHPDRYDQTGGASSVPRLITSLRNATKWVVGVTFVYGTQAVATKRAVIMNLKPRNDLPNGAGRIIGQES